MIDTGRSEVDHLLSVREAAERLGTTERFPRRLISERRIAFVRIGRHVRISERELEAFIESGRVEPLVIRWRKGRVVA